ncbi:MAG: hypothetical protein LBN12_03650 [Clostridiales Family XIII bacterium]|jgi:hypothetical protein|nr:hypothetical protein [Clostridiales Family XIII bacterium]
MKTENRILIILFLAVITVPALMMFQSAGRYLPGDNRMAAAIPKFIKDDGSLVNRTDIEDFANDNIGFRTAAPNLDTRVMYELFHLMLDTAQLQGKENNLFAGDDRYYPSRRAPYQPLSEEELEENGHNIEAAADYFKAKDIPFLFITIPDKEEVYPELYPDTFLKRPDQTRLSQLTDWLTENTEVDAYDLTGALREKASASDDMLWYETGDSAHWNYLGAYYGYREIMGRLQKYDPARKALTLDDFEIAVTTEPYTNWDGSFRYRDLDNTMYTFDYKAGFKSALVDYANDPWAPPDQLELAGFEKNGHFYHYHNDTQEDQLVFFGDSYIYQFLLPYFAETYGDVYLFHLPTDYRIMRPVLDLIGADFVILEKVERSFNGDDFLLMAEEFAP